MPWLRRKFPKLAAAGHRAFAVACVVALAFVATGCAQLLGRPQVVIGVAGPTDMDYPLGGAICRLFNIDSPRHGLRCVVQPSSGSIAAITSLSKGDIDLGIVPSDVFSDALTGRGPFAALGPSDDLRVLFAGHADIFTLVVQRESGIKSPKDLRGKRVGMGNPGSRQRANMERVMAAFGLKATDFAEARDYSPAQQNQAFCSGRLDAMIYSVAHPNGLIRDAILTCGGMLVPVAGPEIDRMLAEYDEYESAGIPSDYYTADTARIQTFGVRAEIVATTRMSEIQAYEIVKAVFDNFSDFRRLHSAFAALSISEMIRSTGHAPLHPGALRYYREQGWTDP